MHINGTKWETVKVEVDSTEVVRNLWENWRYKMPGDYINKNGVWEYWEDTHGSGFTTTYREATPEEVELNHAFQLVVEYALEYEEKK